MISFDACNYIVSHGHILFHDVFFCHVEKLFFLHPVIPWHDEMASIFFFMFFLSFKNETLICLFFLLCTIEAHFHACRPVCSPLSL